MAYILPDTLVHYGIKRRSGRYPYGSGENPYQHEANFMAEVEKLKKQGLSEKQIAEHFNMTIREFKNEKSLARMRVREANRLQVLAYLEEGKGPSEIARIMNKPESTIRSLASEETASKHKQTQATIDILKQTVDTKSYVDVGQGVASSLGIADSRLDTAVQALVDEGYELHNIYVEQAWLPGQYTTVKVLAKPGITKKEVYNDRQNIAVLNEKFVDQHSTELAKLRPVESISSSKVMINYYEDGGGDKDGVIELRRGADGLDLGESRYAQVRIGVDGTHYIKGMVVYSDDLPPGVDIRFNTSKKKSDYPNKLDALKKMEGDPSNPQEAMKASIKPGGQRGYLNIVNEEGDWASWSKNLSSQMLSKQSVQLAKRQLDAAKLDTKREFEEINSLTNPTIKAYLLNQFADKCDTAAVELKAAAMPRQANYAILPLDTIKSNEIYAPHYRNGESVVLIRHPHGGTFEIPELKVNNNNKEAKRIFENAADAVGINSSVAARLSGADFDGDTVIVIPNNSKSVKSSPAIKELQSFEPKVIYAKKASDTSDPPKHATMQREMGIVSNLIADMTLRKAPIEDVTRAVKYSMVAIDAEKHNLDWKTARRDCGITELQEQYQKHPDGSTGGASTLITKSSSTSYIPQVKRAYKADPTTGRRDYIPTGASYEKTNKKTGEKKTVQKQTAIETMRITDDAYSLSSGTVMESVYADYANSMKKIANDARKIAVNTKHISYSPAAAKKYETEAKSLERKVKESESYSPLERKAQILADSTVAMKRADNPNMTKDQASKERARALASARASLGGTKPKVDITDKEWEAIQAGAISKTRLESVLRFTDQEALKKRATPRDSKTMTPTMVALAKSRLAMGYTLAEVADSLGVSSSTISKAVKE